MSQETKTYEGMFLLATGSSDFEAASEPVRDVLKRYQAEVLLLKAWDERKLAYDIRGHRRGLYALSFFNVDPSRVAEIEHDCQLDERILRVLILRRDRLTPEEIEAERASTARPAAVHESDSRSGERDRRRGRYRKASDREEQASTDKDEDSSAEAVDEPKEASGDKDNRHHDATATD